MSVFEDLITDYLAAVKAIDSSPYMLRKEEEARLRAEADADFEGAWADAIEATCATMTEPIDEKIAAQEQAAQRVAGADYELRIQRLVRMASEATDGAGIHAALDEAHLTRSEDTVRAVLSAGVSRHRALASGRFATATSAAERQAFELAAMAWRQQHPSTAEQVARLQHDREKAVGEVMRHAQHVRQMHLARERQRVVADRAAVIK